MRHVFQIANNILAFEILAIRASAFILRMIIFMPPATTPKQLLRTYLKAMTHGKPGDLTNLVTPNLIAIQGDQRVEGSAAAEAYAAHYRQAFPGWRFELEDVVVEGNRLAARGFSVATVPASDGLPAEELRLPWMAFYKVVRGRIAEVRMMSDPSALVSRGRVLSIPIKP